MELTYREQQLIKRGYSEELVKDLTSFDMSYAYKIRDISKKVIVKS